MMRFALVAALALAACRPSGAQSMSAEEEEMLEELGVTGTPMGRKNQEPKAAAVKSDLPYIRCEVCRRVVDMAYTHATEVLDKRFKHKAKRRNEFTQFDGEAALQDFIEKVCVVDKPKGPGEWIARTDLVRDKDRLVLFDTGTPGHCERECRTVERACEEVVEAADTDFSEALFQGVKEGTDLEKVQRLVCNRSAKVCKAKPPPLKADRVDYAFREMSADEKHMADMCAAPRARPTPPLRGAARGAQTLRLSSPPRVCSSPPSARARRMANLKDSGMGGTMYKREDLLKGMDGIQEKIGGITEKLGGLAGLNGLGMDAEVGGGGGESPLDAPVE